MMMLFVSYNQLTYQTHKSQNSFEIHELSDIFTTLTDKLFFNNLYTYLDS